MPGGNAKGLMAKLWGLGIPQGPALPDMARHTCHVGVDPPLTIRMYEVAS